MADKLDPSSLSSGPVTIAFGSQDTHMAAREVARDLEEVRRRATLATARAEFDQLFTNHRAFQDRIAVLRTTAVCPADSLATKLDELAGQWFVPEVASAIYHRIDELSPELTAEALAIANQIDADSASLGDATNPTSVIVRERIEGLDQRVDDAVKEIRAMYQDLSGALAQIGTWVGGLERTAQAFAVTSLNLAPGDQSCVTYCRKVNLVGRGPGYLTLSGAQLIFQPVRTSGMLLWKTDQVGPPEMFAVTGGLTLTDVRRPMLGDHGVTLRQAGPTGIAFQLSLGRESLDDLIGVAG
ncbi:MAG: hypothetical protein ACXWX1_10710 [Aeromicrobium sp.]